MSDIKGLIKGKRRRQTTEPVCLRGDLAGEYDDLATQLERLPDSNKLGGDPNRRRITDEMDRLRAEMEEATVTFRLEAMPDAQFQQLMEDHPPRRDGDEVNAGDAEAGYDRATFYRPLVRACTIDPELDDEDWDLLLGEDGLSPADMSRLIAAALRVNTRRVDVPFSPAGSNGNPS